MIKNSINITNTKTTSHLRRPQIVNYEIQRNYNACNIEPRTNTNNTESQNCM